MKIFLSYASEDSAAADGIAKWLDDKGVAFYDFRRPSRHGGRFATGRPEAIAAADFFVALLSPSLLDSAWCKEDLSLGIRQQQLIARSEPGRGYIQVLQVADVPEQYGGELRKYDWLDMTRPAQTKWTLQELSCRLGIERRPTGEEDPGHHAIVSHALSSLATEKATAPDKSTDMAADRANDKRKKVMVIYGHDKEANTALFNCLRAMGLEPQEWGRLVQQSQLGSPYIGAVLDEVFKNVQAVVAFFTPDEHVIPRASYEAGQNGWRLQARPNVLLEVGMALATHPKETILLVLGHQELPSDLSGRHFIRLNDTAGPLKELGDRLKTAGCAAELDGTSDWLRPDRFPSRDTIQAKIQPRARKSPRDSPPRRAR